MLRAPAGAAAGAAQQTKWCTVSASALLTINDVARRAGVSTATLSRVVNQPDAVRPALGAKVQAAMAQLGDLPHAGARTLKSRRTGTIGAVFPTIGNAIFAKAIDALQRRLAEADHQRLIATSGYDPAAEEAQALNLLARLMEVPQVPTAIVCGNDVLAFGALLEAQRLGIAVPGEVSIVGFDDLELASHLQPALTTVHVPAEAMWRRAAERTLALLRGDAPPREVEIEVTLVVRGSTGPPPSRARLGR